jgi:hypothetical protein
VDVSSSPSSSSSSSSVLLVWARPDITTTGLATAPCAVLIEKLFSSCVHVCQASKLRKALQYCAAMFLLQSFPAACLHSIKAMMIKQGISVTDVGKGKLTAAQNGLGNLAGIVMPAFVWAPLFKYFVGGGQTNPWLRWGDGGHFFVSGGCMLAASLILRSTTGLAINEDTL